RLDDTAGLEAQGGDAELNLGAARGLGQMARVAGAGHHAAELVPAETEMAAMARDSAGGLLAVEHRDLADLEPCQFRRRSKSSGPGAQDDDIALDHSGILSPAIAATLALQ